MANINVGRKSGFIMRSGVRRRETIWAGITETDTVIAAALGAVITNSSGASVQALRPFTVVRTRMNWLLASDQSGATEDFGAGFGVAVVSDQASAIGVTAVPTPVTDIASDLWFVHELQFGLFRFVSGIGFEGVSGIQRTIDSKAMRKVEEGQDIVFVLENTSLSAGSESFLGGRILLKLH